MQDEVNEKTVALSIKAAKLTAALLQAAIKKLLAEGKNQIDKRRVFPVHPIGTGAVTSRA